MTIARLEQLVYKHLSRTDVHPQVSIFEVNQHVAPQQVMFRLIAIQHPAELQDLSLRAVVATSATGKQQQLKKQKQKQNRTKKWIPSHKQG